MARVTSKLPRPGLVAQPFVQRRRLAPERIRPKEPTAGELERKKISEELAIASSVVDLGTKIALNPLWDLVDAAASKPGEAPSEILYGPDGAPVEPSESVAPDAPGAPAPPEEPAPPAEPEGVLPSPLSKPGVGAGMLTTEPSDSIYGDQPRLVPEIREAAELRVAQEEKLAAARRELDTAELALNQSGLKPDVSSLTRLADTRQRREEIVSQATKVAKRLPPPTKTVEPGVPEAEQERQTLAIQFQEKREDLESKPQTPARDYALGNLLARKKETRKEGIETLQRAYVENAKKRPTERELGLEMYRRSWGEALATFSGTEDDIPLYQAYLSIYGEDERVTAARDRALATPGSPVVTTLALGLQSHGLSDNPTVRADMAEAGPIRHVTQRESDEVEDEVLEAVDAGVSDEVIEAVDPKDFNLLSPFVRNLPVGDPKLKEGTLLSKKLDEHYAAVDLDMSTGPVRVPPSDYYEKRAERLAKVAKDPESEESKKIILTENTQDALDMIQKHLGVGPDDAVVTLTKTAEGLRLELTKEGKATLEAAGDADPEVKEDIAEASGFLVELTTELGTPELADAILAQLQQGIKIGAATADFATQTAEQRGKAVWENVKEYQKLVKKATAPLPLPSPLPTDTNALNAIAMRGRISDEDAIRLHAMIEYCKDAKPKRTSGVPLYMTRHTTDWRQPYHDRLNQALEIGREKDQETIKRVGTFYEKDLTARNVSLKQPNALGQLGDLLKLKKTIADIAHKKALTDKINKKGKGSKTGGSGWGSLLKDISKKGKPSTTEEAVDVAGERSKMADAYKVVTGRDLPPGRTTAEIQADLAAAAGDVEKEGKAFEDAKSVAVTDAPTEEAAALKKALNTGTGAGKLTPTDKVQFDAADKLGRSYRARKEALEAAQAQATTLGATEQQAAKEETGEKGLRRKNEKLKNRMLAVESHYRTLRSSPQVSREQKRQLRAIWGAGKSKLAGNALFREDPDWAMARVADLRTALNGVVTPAATTPAATPPAATTPAATTPAINITPPAPAPGKTKIPAKPADGVDFKMVWNEKTGVWDKVRGMWISGKFHPVAKKGK